MRGQFECDVTCFCFYFDLLRSYALCSCCSIVCLRFQVGQIKQIDLKMSINEVNSYKKKIFRYIFGQLHTQEYQVTKKEVVKLQLIGKKSKESHTRLMS